jgi:hypothetical protein
MAEVRDRDMSRDEAYSLVQRMVDKRISNYLIREALMDKGYSAYEANEVIASVRRTAVEPRTSDWFDSIGYVLILLIIIALILYVLVSSVT